MYEEQFLIRLAKLRIKKDVSAMDMSLSIKQNTGYINNIENGKALPSMAGLFFICEYLDITSQDFFDFESEQPKLLDSVIVNLNKRQLKNISELTEDLSKK